MANTKEYNAKYYAEHKTQIAQRRSEKYQKDPEYRERCNARTRQWARKNREKVNAYMRERRAKVDKTNNA